MKVLTIQDTKELSKFGGMETNLGIYVFTQDEKIKPFIQKEIDKYLKKNKLPNLPKLPKKKVELALSDDETCWEVDPIPGLWYCVATGKSVQIGNSLSGVNCIWELSNAKVDP